MLSPLSEDDSFAVSWISLSDLLMIAAVLFAGTSLTLDRSHQKLQVELEEEKRRNSEARDQLKEIQLELRMSLEARDQTNAELLMLADRLNVLRRQLSEQQAEMSRLRSVEAEMERVLARAIRAEEEVKTARERLRIVSEELAEHQQFLAKLKEQTKDFPEKIKQSDLELKVTLQQLEESLKQLEKSQKQLATLREQVMDLQARYNACMKELADLKITQQNQQVEERSFRQELLGIRSRNNLLRRVIFVVDRSGSMTRSSNNSVGSRWEYVCDEIERWLTLLPLKEAQLILFNHVVDTFPADGTFVPVTSTNSTASSGAKMLVKILRETTPDNGTNTAEALRRAYLARDVDAIFLFTDGVPMLKAEINTTSQDYKMLQDEVLEIIAQQQSRSGSPPINVIGLGDYFSTRLSGPDQVHMAFGVFLLEVAQRSGGSFLGR